jgi:hypothetical protein
VVVPAPIVGLPAVEQYRLELIGRYIAAGDVRKALAVADKVKNRQDVVRVLLQVDADTVRNRREHGNLLLQIDPRQMLLQSREGFSYTDRELVLAYVDRELDRIEQRGETTGAVWRYRGVAEGLLPFLKEQAPRVKEEPLAPIPAGKKSPKDECGKEWAMTPTTFYGLFPNGWDQEADHLPNYIINETGRQLRDRLAKAFVENDLPAMKEFCNTFTRLDDIPLSSPWFDTSGGRLHERIKYTLNEKARPVVALLREIAGVNAESKEELVKLARKALERVDAITHPKTDE